VKPYSDVGSATAWGRDDRYWGGEPIERFGADRLELVPLFPPSSPAGILETSAVGNCVLLPGHVLPGTPDVFLAPLVREVVDLAGGEGGDAGIVGGSSISGDRY